MGIIKASGMNRFWVQSMHLVPLGLTLLSSVWWLDFQVPCDGKLAVVASARYLPKFKSSTSKEKAFSWLLKKVLELALVGLGLAWLDWSQGPFPMGMEFTDWSRPGDGALQKHMD